ncbi:MAG: GMP synthase [Ignavibacteriaceae bacterium]|nr:GMP synthase [Ignavibacteriaceae bacterium]
MRKEKANIKVSVIDLYNNERNEGMRCIKEIVTDTGKRRDDVQITYDVFETRYKGDIPDLSSDIFISSGGPGSPFEGVGTKWEKDYFNLLDSLWTHNQNQNSTKKYIFFICHSFQMMGRFFKFAEVNQRYEKSFGVIPFIKTEEGAVDPTLKNLTNPFYAADFRTFQVINPDEKVLKELGIKILSLETAEEIGERTPAIMACRISNEIVGTQFHPEADPESMIFHLKQNERKKHVIDKYGETRYYEMIEWLEHPQKIKLTRKTVLPAFLNQAIDELTAVYIE